MAIKLQLRRDTTANWASANPVLMAGEVGVDTTTKQIKIGDGATAWNSLAYSLTGPTGPTGPMGPTNLSLTGPVLSIIAGVPISFTLQTKDAYTTYSVSAVTGTVTLVGTTITYTGHAIGTDTITITAGTGSRTVSVDVLANTLGNKPADPPTLGSALEGGFYTGAVWDTAAAATGSFAIGTGVVTLTIDPAMLPRFYIGQPVRLTPTDSRNGLMTGTVLAGSGDQVTLDITARISGALGTTYTGWVIAVPWKIIVAPKASGENESVQYKNANTADPAACHTLTNGRASTAAMQALNPDYPMANWISQINAAGGINGYTDWYIPARDELELIWRNLKPVTNNNYTTPDRGIATYTIDANRNDVSAKHGENLNSYPEGAAYTASVPGQTAVTAFQSGGSEALTFGLAYYWSSSEYSSAFGWLQNYNPSNPGYQYYNSYKTFPYRARAVRRSIL